MALVSIGDLIVGSLRDLGVVASGRSPTTSQLADGLDGVNLMLRTWAARRFLIPFITQESFSWGAGLPSRTIGATGNLVTPRPFKITNAFLRDAASFDQPIRIGSKDEWDSAPSKTTTGRPGFLYYDQTFPNGTIYLLAVPDSTYTIFLDSQKPFTEYAATTDPIGLSLDFHETLRSNLAVKRLAKEYGVTPSRELIDLARETMGDLKALRADPVDEVFPAQELMRGNDSFNILRGY